MSAKRKNIWVLGGTGFIGRALVEHLAEDPSNALHLLVHRNVPYRLLEPFNTFTGSLPDFDLTWWEKYPPDVIFHLARLGGGNAVTRYFASYRGAQANRRIIRYLSALKSPPIIVYVSGSLMYGHQNEGQWATEQSPLLPTSYARYYIQGELPWMEAQQAQLLDIRFARPGWILGESSWFRGFYWDTFLKTGMIPLFGNGSQLMSLIQVDDCAGQIANLARNGAKCQNLNIFSGSPVSQEAFAETLALLLHTQTKPFTMSELKLRYGNTVAEALTSSIPLHTQYPEMAGRYTPRYPDLKSMLFKTLSTMKHNEPILAKTP